MTSQGSPYARFRRALEGGNLLIIRAAAAELPRIGLAEAAAILLIIERAEPQHYERAARRWLARLCEECRGHVDLRTVSEAAAALSSLPEQPAMARAMLAAVCRRAELTDAAREFTPEP